MEMRIILQRKDQPPRLTNLTPPMIDLSANEVITLVLVEGGMQSGEPAVLIVSSDNEGTVCLQTSLDKYLMGGQSMLSLAENQLGWKRPEGYMSLMPPDKATRKALLEGIRKELEEWDELDP